MNIEQFRHAEELFDAALELPTDQRHTFLEQACGPDTTLLDSVVRLLRHVGWISEPGASDHRTEDSS